MVTGDFGILHFKTPSIFGHILSGACGRAVWSSGYPGYPLNKMGSQLELLSFPRHIMDKQFCEEPVDHSIASREEKFSSPDTMQKNPSKKGGENSPVGFRRFPVKILPLTNPMSLSSSIADVWFRQVADLSGPRWEFPWDPSGLVDPSKMTYEWNAPQTKRGFLIWFLCGFHMA